MDNIIFTEISVDPHYHEVNYTNIKKFEFDSTTPPHVIFKKEFKTWIEAQDFLVKTLQLKTEGPELEVLLDELIDQPKGANEYVGVELTLMDITSTVYTKATLAIEGQKEVN